MTTILIALGGIFVFWLLVAGYNVLSGPPAGLGVQDGRLAEVPDSPNAVSSYADDEQHGMAAISYSGDADAAMEKVARVVSQMPRSEIVDRQDNYLRAEYQSAVFRFIDDVEFLVEETEGVIHFRSASRMGHSDLGVNRSRMEDFIRRFTELQDTAASDD